MTARVALHFLVLTAVFSVAGLSAPAPVRAQAQAEGCNARARIPWTKAGEGFFAEAIVSGPSCAHAVVLFVARRPGGMPARLLSYWPVLPGNAIEIIDIGPVAGVPALAGARDAAAMTAALPQWLIERLRTQAPSEHDDLAARQAAGETRGDCGARVTMPWPGAGAGYVVEVFADGTDCNNAAFALVVRAPDGKPLHSRAMSAFAYTVYQLPKAVTTKGEMAAALRDWIRPGNDTTETLADWPVGKTEGEIIRNTTSDTAYMINTDKRLTRETWNELRAAKRPMFGFKVSPETGLDLVLMPDGRVIEAGAIWTNY
jgi:hypothetical protein